MPMRSNDSEHLLELLKSSPTMVYTCRASGDFGATAITENVASVLGYSPAEFVGSSSFWLEHIHPEDRDKTVEGLGPLFEHGTHSHDYRFRHADGSYRWMNDQLILVRDDQGNPKEIVGYCVDITGRKLLEEGLQRSAARYSRLVDTIPYGVEDVDVNGTIVLGNAALHRLFGFEPGEMVGRSLYDDCVNEEDRAEMKQNLRLAMEKQPPPEPYYAKRLKKDGTAIDIEVAWDYRWGDDGQVAGLTAVVTDITERKRAEEALAASQERFNLAVSGADEGLWDKSLITGAEYWAPRFYELIGYSPDEIEAGGDTFRGHLHPDDYVRVTYAYEEHIAGRTPDYDVDYRMRTKSGDYRWIRSRARAVRDESGTPTRIVGFISDITEARRLETTLKETQQILDSTPDPIFIVNERGEIAFLNSQATATFGHRREELLGRSFADLLPGYDDLDRRHGVHGRASTGRRRDGSIFAVEISLNPILTGAGTLVAAAIRDVSKRKEAEQRQQAIEAKLQQAQKLESLGVLAGGIAHDFNNLLMGVLGNAEVAMLDLPSDSPTRTELSNISAAALRAADLTKQMLAYSGRGKVQVEPLDLSALVRDIGHLLEVSTPKRVAVIYDFADDLPAIDADAAQIQQVIMNLIINASESIEEGTGLVTVTTGRVNADRAFLAETYLDDNLPEGEYVCLAVTDTGSGMDKDTQRRIFDPFFSTKFAGRGLGLAALLGIIRGHGGAMKIDSHVGEGSTFKVLFPASGQLVRDSVLSAVNERWQGSGTVLVVDDEEAVRIAATRMIETCGLSVLAASDGDEAIQTFREHRDEIVAVLLDQTMPRMDGEQTLRELRRLSPDLKVILSSGYNELETTDRFAGMGMSAFIQKPYGVNHLVGTLRSVIETHHSSPV